MAKKIKSNTAGTGRIISPVEKKYSALLTDFAKKLSDNCEVAVELRDICDHGMDAMVRKNKIIINKSLSSDSIVGSLSYACAVRNALFGTDEQAYYSSKGCDIWSTSALHRFKSIDYEGAAERVRKKYLNSDAYSPWLLEAAGFENKVGPDGQNLYVEMKRKDYRKNLENIIKRSEEWGSLVEQETIIEGLKLQNNKVKAKIKEKIDNSKKYNLSPKTLERLNKKLMRVNKDNPSVLYRLAQSVYISAHLSLGEKQLNHIQQQISSVGRMVDNLPDIKGALSILISDERIKKRLPEEMKSPRVKHTGENQSTNDREFLLDTLMEQAYKNKMDMTALWKESLEARKEKRLSQFIDELIETVCDKPSIENKEIVEEKKKRTPDGGDEGKPKLKGTVILRPRKGGGSATSFSV